MVYRCVGSDSYRFITKQSIHSHLTAMGPVSVHSSEKSFYGVMALKGILIGEP